jgi:hypothetical protein
MSLDHRDDAAVLAFSEEVDSRLGRGEAGVEPWTIRLISAWVLSGLLITLAVRSDGVLGTVLYVAALAIVVVWVLGFYARASKTHWYRG